MGWKKKRGGGPDTPFCTMTKQHSTKCKLNQVDLEEYKTLLDIYNYWINETRSWEVYTMA